MLFLRSCIYELHGRSGETDRGLSRLTPATIWFWQQLKHIPLDSDEIDALFTLDDILMHPEIGQKKDDAPQRETAAARAWPSKKATTEGGA